MSSDILESIDLVDEGISDAMDNYICVTKVDLADVHNQSADEADFTGTNSVSTSTVLISTTVDENIFLSPLLLRLRIFSGMRLPRVERFPL